MNQRTLAELADLLGTMSLEDPGTVITGVTTDTRSVGRGELFVAIAGETFDGNDFLGAAMEAGAAGVVTSRHDAAGMPRILVADTLVALRDIAAIRRDELEIPVVAITGSTGKTSTKDLLAAALPGSWASPRSFNNEIGVPLTVLGTPDDAGYLVAEVGSRGPGHISFLMPAVRPDVAVVTNLGVVHLETFGTTDDLADAKFELIEALGPQGIAVVPEDEPRLHRGQPNMLTFGTTSRADVQVSDIVIDDYGLPSFVIRGEGASARVKLAVAGAHQALNAAAAVGAGLALGVDFGSLLGGLESASGSPWRMEIHRGRYTVVNDAYNANPDSMEAAMRTVAAMPGRHLAVLGTMAELGPLEESEHRRIGELADELGFAAVVTVGDERGIARGAGPIGHNVPDVDAAQTVIERLVRDGDVVLVKASRAIGLEAVALRLAEGATT
jgi:UDP-N-acetylmuramoyl-tripeptide--D-alanyl-D-alanine ligase